MHTQLVNKIIISWYIYYKKQKLLIMLEQSAKSIQLMRKMLYVSLLQIN